MSERFTMRVPAGTGNVLAPGALDQQVGGTISIRHGDGTIEGVVIAAEIVKDGTAALVTVEVPDGTLPKRWLAGYSISEQP